MTAYKAMANNLDYNQWVQFTFAEQKHWILTISRWDTMIDVHWFNKIPQASCKQSGREMGLWQGAGSVMVHISHNSNVETNGLAKLLSKMETIVLS